MPRHSWPDRADRRCGADARDGRGRRRAPQVNIICIVDDAHPPEACVGDWVLLHVGFAMSRIDEAEAAETLRVLTELGEAQAELDAMRARRLMSHHVAHRAASALSVPARPAAGRRRGSMRRCSHSVAAEGARHRARPMRASSPNRARRWSPRRARSPTSTAAAAGCSPWATAARAAMRRMSRSSSCTRSPPADRRWPRSTSPPTPR